MMNLLITLMKNHWIIVTIVIFTAITALSLYPLEKLSTVPGSDKIHHLIAYAALIFPTALRKPKYWQLIGVLFIFWSGVIELLQPFVNRYGEWLDVAANTIGILCGILIAQLINLISSNYSKPK